MLGQIQEQEAIRDASANAESLAAYLAIAEKIILDNGIDLSCIWSLDEAGVTPGRDVRGQSKKKACPRSRARGEQHRLELNDFGRIAMAPAVSAAGESAAPMLALKGSHLKHREINQNWQKVTQALLDALPRHAIVTTRKQHAGLDRRNFYRWSEHFAKEARDLAAGGRKMLLLYDGYRSHLGFDALHSLGSHGIIAHALPAHASGDAQPLAVALRKRKLSPFKSALNDCICSCASANQATAGHDELDFCHMLTVAHHSSFARQNIKAGLRQSGLCPFDPPKLLKSPLPESADNISALKSADEMQEALQQKRKASAGRKRLADPTSCSEKRIYRHFFGHDAN